MCALWNPLVERISHVVLPPYLEIRVENVSVSPPCFISGCLYGGLSAFCSHFDKLSLEARRLTCKKDMSNPMLGVWS